MRVSIRARSCEAGPEAQGRGCLRGGGQGDSLILTLRPSEEDLELLRLMEDVKGVGVPRLRRREIYEDTR